MRAIALLSRGVSLRQWVVLWLLVLHVAVPVWGATSKLNITPGTEITFCDSGCTYAIALTNIATATGAISAQADLGATTHAADYELRCVFQVNATVAVGTTAEVYVATSNGTYVDGTVGTASATFATDKRNNLKLVGVVLADQTAATVDMVGSWPLRLQHRYVSVGVWNAFGVNLKSGSNTSRCLLTPMPLENQ